jgi:hypothetical protein
MVKKACLGKIIDTKNLVILDSQSLLSREYFFDNLLATDILSVEKANLMSSTWAKLKFVYKQEISQK